MILREKTRLWLTLALIVSFLAGCGPSPEEHTTVAVTLTVAAATDTPMPTDTLAPIDAPTSTQTTPSTETPVLVPRYMLPSAPYFPVEILGVICNYQGDIWGEKAAFIAYDCPDLNVTWLSARFTNIEKGEAAKDLFDQIPSEEYSSVGNSRIGPEDMFGQLPSEGTISIPPADLLSKYDNITILGRVENSEYVYFMMYETENYVISSEVFFPENTATLEEFYPDNVEKVFRAVLEVMLENIKHGGSSLQPTPMAIDKQNLYNQIAPWLVTMLEANEFYQGASDMFGDPFDGNWLMLGDDVNAERESVCRMFEDRSNADAPLVAFYNCVYIRPDFALNNLKENFPNSVVLESAFEYPDQSIIYGHKLNNGHTSLNAFILQDKYLIYMFVESRTLVGQTPEDVFEGFNDGFIYNVMMTNLERYSEGLPPTPTPNLSSPFVGDWVSTDPGDGSKQHLSISENNGEYSISYTDDVATSCGLDGAGNTIAAAGTGLGTVNGNVLGVDFSIYCMTTPQTFLASIHVDIIYNKTTDTIEDSTTVWSRSD